MTDDNYGSAYRERMKRIMQEPATKWQPMNRRREDKRVLLYIGVIAICASAVLIFLSVLSYFKPYR